jgi:LysR family hydrogen peroxide-inducible transcriptional activator
MILPTLRQLSFLVALADQGSFVAAAEAVGVTQPSLSAGVKELEGLLGVRLVERGRSGLSFTPAGEETLRRARALLSDAAALSEAARGAAEPLSGGFRLGVIPTIAPFLLPRALPSVKARFPRLRLFLREDLTGRLLDAVRARALDAAVIALPYSAPGIETLALGEDEFLFVGPADHPLAARSALNQADLEGETLLLLEDGHCLRDHALAACRLAQAPGEAEVRATSLFTLVQMAAGGLGVSLLPRMAADAGVAGADVAVRPFDPPLIGRQIGVAWRKGAARADEARALAGVLKAAAFPPAA